MREIKVMKGGESMKNQVIEKLMTTLKRRADLLAELNQIDSTLERGFGLKRSVSGATKDGRKRKTAAPRARRGALKSHILAALREQTPLSKEELAKRVLRTGDLGSKGLKAGNVIGSAYQLCRRPDSGVSVLKGNFSYLPPAIATT